MQIVIPLTRREEPLSRQIYQHLREAILSGAFGRVGRLPSTRDLAEQLGVSRSVVVEAFEQLLAEGFVAGRKGSGTYVAEQLLAPKLLSVPRATQVRLSRFGVAARHAGETRAHPQPTPRHRYDFRFGRSESDIEVFPFAYWQRTVNRRVRKMTLAEVDYGTAAGDLALREAICGHLQRSRRVACDATQVIVTNGSQQALDLIVRVMVDRGDRVCIEDPSYQGTRQILLAAGARLVPVAVDSDGLRTEKLPKSAKLCFVTPSHQFPTGAILPLERRLALLAWAQRSNAVIVEDDYDGEFRYDGHPLESLQGLDTQGRTIYVGTFSRTIFPALRVGYLVAPKQLVAAMTGAKWLNDQHSATLEQRALAEFIADGAYERYLRRLRRRNSARRAALLSAVAEKCGDRVELTGQGAGAHVALWLPKRVSEAATVAKAAAAGVGVYPMSPYSMQKPMQAAILLGYARLREKEIREGIARLAEVLR